MIEWLILPVPFLGLVLMTIAFSMSPETSNSVRSWAKIGFVPLPLINVFIVAGLLSK